MRPNVTASHSGSITSLTRLAVGGIFLLVAASTAHAGANPPTLSVIGGTGIPGGTVNVTFALSNDPTMLAFGSGIEMDFNKDILSFTGNAKPPRCTVASRLSTSHVIQGPGEFQPGVFDAEIFANPVGENSPLGNGDLATCAFNVAAGAPVGTTPLTIDPEQSFLNGSNGLHLSPVNFVNGEVVIALATPTFTTTATPTVKATATSTNSVGPTATRTVAATATNTVNATATRTVAATATNTVNATSTSTVGTATSTGSPRGTATNTVGPTRTSTVGTPVSTATRTITGGVPTKTAQKSTEDDGCNIVATEQASSGGAFALLLAPALLLWARRRRF